MKLSLILVLGFILAISGCASSTIVYDSQGRQQVLIDCTDQGSWNICYKEAARVCSSGYFVDERRGEGVTNDGAMGSFGQRHFRELLIRCK